jgi:hypothetical protein
LGNQLFKEVADATGLPLDLITTELSRVLTAKGVELSEVTIEDMRSALADYLREVIVEAKEKYSEGFWIDEESPGTP